MKIVCILQVYNEIETGHLFDFFKYNKGLFDSVVAYDDGSTDGSWEYLQEHADHVIRANNNNFKAEISHKHKLLNKANEIGADYIVFLDADEILALNRNQLENYCREYLSEKYDGIRVNFLNLWRSHNYRRVDSLFDKFLPVKIWRHQKDVIPYANVKAGLHQEPHPDYVKNIIELFSINIIHMGFSSQERIVRKFSQYRSHGQSGFNLMRLIDETNLRFEKVDENLLPADFIKDSQAPSPMTIKEYIALLDKYRQQKSSYKFSIVCLIYKDIRWLQFVYDQVLKYTDLSQSEFFFVANDATQEVKQYLKDNLIPHYIYENSEEQRKEHYINNVYRAYNYGAKVAKGHFVVFINSDMAFSPDWLINLHNKYNGNNCVASRLVESGRLASGLHGIEKNFGYDFDNYKEHDFLSYVQVCSEPKAVNSGLFMPLMIKRDHFWSVNGYPEGNIVEGSDIDKPIIAKPGDILIPGDVVLMSKLKNKGITHQTSFDSIVYHFQEGEKRQEVSKEITDRTDKKILVLVENKQKKSNEMSFFRELSNLSSVEILDKDFFGTNNFADIENVLLSKYPNVKMVFVDGFVYDVASSNTKLVLCFLDYKKNTAKSSILVEKNLKTNFLKISNDLEFAQDFAESEIHILGQQLSVDFLNILISYRNSALEKIDVKSNFSFIIEYWARRLIFRKLLGRDSFYTVAEVSVWLKKHSPVFIFKMLRATWRLVRKQ